MYCKRACKCTKIEFVIWFDSKLKRITFFNFISCFQLSHYTRIIIFALLKTQQQCAYPIIGSSNL